MTVVITNHRERIRFLKFAVVGVIGAVVDFGTMNLLNHVFGASLVVAGAISFIAAIISNFVWNRYWTYPDSRSRPVFRQLIMFTIVSVIGLLIRVPTLAILESSVDHLFANLSIKLPYFSTNFYADNVTLAIAVGIVSLWNFFINRYWTYNDVE